MATGIGKYLQYVSDGIAGGRKSGAAFNIATGPPEFLGILSDPDTAYTSLIVYARIYHGSGRMIAMRQMGYDGMYNGEPMWTYQTVWAPASINSKKYIQFGGTITGGSFTFTHNGIESEKINYTGLTLAQQQALFEKHPDIGVGNVLLSWDGVNNRLYYEFRAALAKVNINAISAKSYLIGTGATVQSVGYESGTSDFPTLQDEYSWDMIAWDGSRWSGDKLDFRSAIGPARCSFWTDYLPGMTIGEPDNGDTATSPRPTLSWAWVGGTIGSVPVVRQATSIYDITSGSIDSVPDWREEQSGTNTNTYTSYRPTVDRALRDTHEYRWIQEAWKKSGAYVKVETDFTVDYTRPAIAPDYTMVNETNGAYITAFWTPTGSDIERYVFKIRPDGAAEDGDENVEIWDFADKTRNHAVLAKIPKNRDMILSFYTEWMIDDVPILSLAREKPVRLDIDSVMLVNPITLEWVALKAHLGRNLDYQQEPGFIQPWFRDAPVVVWGGAQSRLGSMTAKLMGDAEEQQAQYQLIEKMYKNAKRTPLIYTDTDAEIANVVMGAPKKFRPGTGQAMQVALTFTEVSTSVRPAVTAV